jgi:hypothetical protein
MRWLSTRGLEKRRRLTLVVAPQRQKTSPPIAKEAGSNLEHNSFDFRYIYCGVVVDIPNSFPTIFNYQ